MLRRMLARTFQPHLGDLRPTHLVTSGIYRTPRWVLTFSFTYV